VAKVLDVQGPNKTKVYDDRFIFILLSFNLDIDFFLFSHDDVYLFYITRGPHGLPVKPSQWSPDKRDSIPREAAGRDYNIFDYQSASACPFRVGLKCVLKISSDDQRYFAVKLRCLTSSF